jgi:hypothetical protein
VVDSSAGGSREDLSSLYVDFAVVVVVALRESDAEEEALVVTIGLLRPPPNRLGFQSLTVLPRSTSTTTLHPSIIPLFCFNSLYAACIACSSSNSTNPYLLDLPFLFTTRRVVTIFPKCSRALRRLSSVVLGER